MDSKISKFNHSLIYRKFLQNILPDCEDRYLCAFEEDTLVGVLPLFIKRGSYGAVINSLPFYGSHGGIVVASNASEDASYHLISALSEICNEVDAISCTLVESPWDRVKDRYAHFEANLHDTRIGQITSLPAACGDSCRRRLNVSVSSKTRNMVRKGLKGGFEVRHSGSDEVFNTLYKLHDDNIRGVVGFPNRNLYLKQ